MPKFIYTIIITLLLSTAGIYFILTKTSPEIILNKILLSFLISFFISLFIPFAKVLSYLSSKNKEDLNQVFRNSFKRNLLVSIFIGLIIFIKTIYYFNLTLLGLLLFLFLLGKYLLPKLRKSRKKPKY